MVAELTRSDAPPSLELTSFCLAFTEHAPLPMATVEGASHILRSVNSAFCHLLDQTRNQLVGKSFREILPEQNECATLLDGVYRTGRPERHTEQEPSKRRPIFWSFTMWPVRRDERPVVILIQVTETAQSHERMVAMNEALLLGSLRQQELTEVADHANARLEELVSARTAELTATNKQLEAFVYSIAHDLRAPLRSMQGFSAMLLAEAKQSWNETARNHAERIAKSAQFMDAMLIDLLAFSCLGSQNAELVSVNLGSVVESVASRLEKEIQEANARVEYSGPWPSVQAHELSLAQILFNLAGNALKFVTPAVSPIIRLRSEEHGEFIRIWVEDNGPGIAPEHQEQIFKLFTRLEGAKYPGTGIGLAIVKKAVERMGGRVGVESVSGQGSRFWFDLRRSK